MAEAMQRPANSAPLRSPGSVPAARRGHWPHTARATVAAAFCIVSCSLSLPACGPTIVPSFDSPEPAARNSAIVRAGANKDQEAIPDLVRMLDSDDPATRFLAISALDRITGERFGYEASQDEARRVAAVQRWRSYANDYRPRGTSPLDPDAVRARPSGEEP